MNQRRRMLRVLIVSRQENFRRVLATNLQSWGYQVVSLSSDTGSNGVVASDILLYDLDENVDDEMWEMAHRREHVLSATHDLVTVEAQYDTRLTIVLSSRSVSRKMLECMDAIALVQKPFEMRRLQRYLQVLQHVLCSSQEEPVEEEEHVDQKKRVLVVDDDVLIARVIQQSLQYEPEFEVVVAHDGLEALEQCIRWQPQCIVIDLLMPWMNGHQVIRCLAAGTLSHQPTFIVISALTRLEQPMGRISRFGTAVRYIDKPFQIEHVVATIKQVCSGHASACTHEARTC